MSVITTKSSILSILKTPSGTPRNSLNRVRFKLPSNIKKIFLDFKSGANLKDYENLVCTIRDSEICDNDLLSLLTEAKNCTSLLNYDLRLFVQALILVKWSHRGDNVVKCYQEFINDLISAHSCHIKLVIDQLIKLFLCVEQSDWVGSLPTENAVKEFNNIHIILQTTLTTVPMSEDILIDSIKHNFPYFNATHYKQVSYLSNILRIIQYQIDIRVNILQIAIDKLLLLDVHSPRDEILQYEETTDTDELLYEMEVDGIEKTDNSMKHPIANTFDLMMDVVFQFIKNECYIDGKFMKNKCLELYNDLVLIFENVILPTHECHHVQYIMFYICSFEPSIANDFLKLLWKNVTLPNLSPVIRQTAVSYVSSFLARADYLALGYLKSYLIKFSDWIHNYITCHDSTSEFQFDYKQHCVFYSICQAMFYLIAFRHQDLVNSSVKLVFLQSLNLGKVVSCKLNPLKYCLPTIVDNFAAVTRAYQLAYCYTIIENNSRGTVPLVGRGGQYIINSVINMYFPFDPYVLLRTCIHINPLYREYKSILKPEVAHFNAKKPRLYSGTEDEDDFIKDEIFPDGNEISF